MVSEQIEPLFYANGYDKIPSNLPEYTFYWHRENQGVTVLFVIDYRQGLYISDDQHAHLKGKILEFFHKKGESDVHILTLAVCDDTEKARRLCERDSFCWIIDAGADRLLVYENQVPDFYGWRTILEDFLTDVSLNTGRAGCASERDGGFSAAESGAVRKKRGGERLKNLPFVNIGVVLVNVIVFLICTFTGELLYNKGAFGVREIAESGEYYRLFTSMFLHSDIRHLFSNMIVLYYVGEIVERKIGHIPYMALYFLSGMAGDIFSMGYEFLSGEYYSSVGASGAVFGVEGALLLLVIVNHGRLEYMTMGRLAFAIAFSLYCGFTETNVNNAAHVGGVLMGFAVTALITMLRPRGGIGKGRDYNEN